MRIFTVEQQRQAASKRATDSYNLYIERWKNGKEDGCRGTTATSAHIRRYLFDKFKSACSKCGWSEVNPTTGRVPLEIEHKDGRFTNNREENLDLLCPNCHSLTATYRSLNKGNGRPRVWKVSPKAGN